MSMRETTVPKSFDAQRTKAKMLPGLKLETLAASTNYSLAYTGANVTITARPLTVTANSQSVVYGNSVPTLTYTIGGSGLVNNDTLTGALATTASSTSNVGSYGITQGTLANPNYTITSYTGANVTITVRPITVTATAQTMTYGDAVPSLTYAVGGSGLVNNDTLTGALATTASSTSNVGSYGITQGTLAASSNYSLTYTGANVTITARPLTVTANSQSVVYGNSVPTLTYTIGGSGLVNNDTLTGALVTTASSTSNVGSYGITQGTLAASSNYSLAYTGANVTITARPLTVTVAPQTKVYDGTTAASVAGTAFTVSGLVSGQSVSITPTIAANYNSADVATATTVTGTLASSDYAAGTGTTLSNYTLPTSFSATGSITPASLTVTVAPQTKVYDGTTTASVAGTAFTVSGLVSGQSVSITPTIAANYNSADVAAANTVTGTLASSDYAAGTGTTLSNYTLPTSFSATGSIKPAALTIAITGNPSKTADGTTTVSLTPSNFGISGFVSGQGATINQNSGTFASASAGPQTVTAVITASNVVANAGTNLSNYALPSSASGSGTITAASTSGLSILQVIYSGSDSTTSASQLNPAASAQAAALAQLMNPTVATQSIEKAAQAMTNPTFIPFPAPDGLPTRDANTLAPLPAIISVLAPSVQVSESGSSQTIAVNSGEPIMDAPEQILLQGPKQKNWKIKSAISRT
jgi:hypothetical protein